RALTPEMSTSFPFMALSCHRTARAREGTAPSRARSSIAASSAVLPPPAADLDGRCTTLAGADADHFLHRGDEYLSVSDPAGTRSLEDRLHGFPDPLVGNQDGDLHLGQEVHHVLGSPVELGVPLLAPEPLHLADRHSV